MVIIYGADNCPWCVKAKELATNFDIPYTYRDIGDNELKEQLRSMLPDVKTIPQIWWYERHIGGYEDFAREIENTLMNYGQQAC
jgi:glutaredoxin